MVRRMPADRRPAGAVARPTTTTRPGSLVSVYESKLERLAAVVIAMSRVVPGGWLLQKIFLGCDIPRRVQLGRDTRFPHGAQGVVIHPDVVIGDRAIIYHGVTLGMRDSSRAVPVVEDDVLIGAGAKVLGGVRLGRGCQIGANAVVVTDVPAGATAAGPAATVRA